jgi:hypothetical protein
MIDSHVKFTQSKYEWHEQGFDFPFRAPNLWRCIRPIITHTNIHIHTTQLSVDNVDILTYTPCRLPLPKRKFKWVFDPSGHLPSPSPGQEPSFAPPSPSPSTCALQYPPSPANPHAPNRSPSLTSAVPSSTQVHHSCLSAPSIALSSPFITPPALQHVSNLHTCHLHPAVPSRYRPPLPSTFSCHPMYSLPPFSCALPASSWVSRPTRQRGVSEGC